MSVSSTSYPSQISTVQVPLQTESKISKVCAKHIKVIKQLFNQACPRGSVQRFAVVRAFPTVTAIAIGGVMIWKLGHMGRNLVSNEEHLKSHEGVEGDVLDVCVGLLIVCGVLIVAIPVYLMGSDCWECAKESYQNWRFQEIKEADIENALEAEAASKRTT